jgi:hypothetical protein
MPCSTADVLAHTTPARHVLFSDMCSMSGNHNDDGVRRDMVGFTLACEGLVFLQDSRHRYPV